VADKKKKKGGAVEWVKGKLKKLFISKDVKKKDISSGKNHSATAIGEYIADRNRQIAKIK
jgi:hypothetical protein